MTTPDDMISRSGLINTKPEFMNDKVVRDTKYRTTKDRIYARAWNACNAYWLDTITNAPTVDLAERTQVTVFCENADENAIEDMKTELQNVLEGQKPCGMNDILRSLIKWTEENEVIPEIYFLADRGSIWLNLALRKHRKSIQHAFYVPGGVLCLNNWDMFPMEEEVNLFIEEAKEKLL